MKFYCASLIHETSRWSPIPTDLDSYREVMLYAPTTGEGVENRDQTLVGVNWSKIMKARGHELCLGLLACAHPGRPTGAKAYAFLKNEIVESLRRSLPVDGVLLFLHGAQVADGVDDCAGDVLRAVRGIVGPQVPVGVVFDLHGNVSDDMVTYSDVLLSCLEYPHGDFGSRAEELTSILEAAVAKKIRPRNMRRRVPMLGTYYTTQQPMRDLVDWAKGFEGQDGVLAVSVTHGFAWSDVSDCGANVIVCADRDHGAAAERIGDTIAERYFELRDQIRAPRLGAEDAVRAALAEKGSPVVIADTTDNPGGGAAGDSTFLLKAMLDAKVTNAAIGMIWDPVAVAFAKKAGVGAKLPMRIGGKAGPASGTPVDLEVEIVAYREDATQIAQEMRSPIGPAAVLQAAGIRIVVCAQRQQVFDTACFEEFGIHVSECRIVVVKSHQHFYEKFGPLAAKVLYATPPGSVNMNYPEVPFVRIVRPLYPIDLPPFETGGRVWGR